MHDYIIKDFYENPFGEAIYIAHSEEEAKKFMDEFAEETDGECRLTLTME